MRRWLYVLPFALALSVSACDAGGDGGRPTTPEARSDRLDLLLMCWDAVVLPAECREVRCESDSDCELWEYCESVPTSSQNGERFCDIRWCSAQGHCFPPKWMTCSAENCVFPQDKLTASWNQCEVYGDCHVDAWGEKPEDL